LYTDITVRRDFCLFNTLPPSALPPAKNGWLIPQLELLLLSPEHRAVVAWGKILCPNALPPPPPQKEE
jgi:hypothetical protein